MDASGDFVTQFYNLEGDLISERKRNFSKLIKAQTVPLNEEDLKTLNPRNYLESLFEIDIFIHFKIVTKLLEVIKGGNEVFISKILRHPLLLKEIIGDISGDSFVNDFLPCMSYAMRMKVLKKISFFLDEFQMDVIVSCVHKRYGFDIAKQILHTCSSQKVKDFLSEYVVILKPRQIKFIFNKDPDLLLTYLRHYKMAAGHAFRHKNICNYIALNNSKFWLKLQEDKLISVAPLGRRTSKHFINVAVTDLRNNVKEYSNFLKLNVIVKKLQGIFGEVYSELFPKDVNKLSTKNFCHNLLQYYPKSKQWDLFAQTFMNVYGNDILNNLISLNKDFVPFFPNKTVMNMWGELKYKERKDNNILQYCDPSKAIPLITEEINVTSGIFQRSKLLLLLVKTCATNKDITSLEEVLKYIVHRHRNENATQQVLTEIRNSFKLEELNGGHWNYVNELIVFLKLRKIWCSYDICIYAPKYMEYLITHGKSIKKEVAEFINDNETFRGNYRFQLENPLIQKQILIETFMLFPEVKQMGKKKFEERVEDFVNIIIDFNNKNHEHVIDLVNIPYLFSYVQSLFDKECSKLSYAEQRILDKILSFNFKFPQKPIISIENAKILQMFRSSVKNFWLGVPLEMIVKKKARSEFENEVLQFFWDNLLHFFSLRVRIVPWFFAHEPRIILPHLDQLLSVDPQCISIKNAKLMSHMGFDKRILDFTAAKLKYLDHLKEQVVNKTTASSGDMEVGNQVAVKIDLIFYTKIIKVLSILLPTKEYIKIVTQRFIPEQTKIDTSQNVLRDFLILQREVARSFTNVQEPGDTLPVIMEFCAGDYLQSTLPSLYSVCYRAPERLLYPYMEVLSKRAVSVRKHALFLSCELLTYEYAINMLKKSNSTNVSSQKHVFSATLKYWRKNPTELLLNQVISNLTVIDKNDTETLKSLIKIKVPKKYDNIYKEHCWYFFENIRTQEVYVENYLVSLLQSLVDSKDVLELLPINFYKHIIARYFIEKPEKDYCLNNINYFVTSFLCLKSEQSDNFKFVFEIILLFKKNNNTTIIREFFGNFYQIAKRNIKDNSKIDVENNYHIELFKQNWHQLFTPIEMFNECVLIDLLYLKSKSSCLVENYAKEVVIYLEELVTKYGPYIYTKFKNLLLSKDPFSDHEKYGFDIAKKILHTCSSRKINDFLSEYEVTLKPRQIKFIFNKDHDLLRTYLKHFKTVEGHAFNHKNICNYVALKDSKFWLQLQEEKLIIVTPLGRRSSSKFINVAVSDLPSNVNEYSKFLKLDVIVKKLKGNFWEVYSKLFPNDVKKLSTNNFCHRLLQYYPKQKRWDLFARAYMHVFGNDILDNLISLNNDFISFLPNKTIMNSWGELKYKDTNDNDLLKYCGPSQAIPLIKEKINVTSDILQRTKLLLLLVKTSAINKDPTSLEEVLKYIVNRHRNEDATQQVLDEIKNSFKLEELRESHWNYINELIVFLKLKKQWYFYDICIFAPKYMEYLILHKKSIKDQVTEFIIDTETFGGNYRFELKNPVIERQIWIEIFILFPEVKKLDKQKLEERLEHFVNIIITFNEKNFNHAIDLENIPYLFSYLKSLFDKDCSKLSNAEKRLLQRILLFQFKFPQKPIFYIKNDQVLHIFHNSGKGFWLEDPLVEIVKKKDRSKFENQVLDFFWDNLVDRYFLRARIVPWLFAHEPRIILPHFDRLLTLDPQCISIKGAKLMSHLGFDKRILEFSRTKLKSLDQLKEKLVKKTTPASGDMEVDSQEIDVTYYSGIIEVLSELLPTKEYIQIVTQQFLPGKMTIDTTQKDLREFFMLQRKVARSFTKVQEPGEALPIVMEFCAGDYLQSVLPSLYSICYRAPERLLYPYMEILSKRAVSVRKHALFLSCELLTYEYAINMLKKSNSTNVSSQKHVFSTTLKYWRKNPSELLLNQVVSNLYVIDKNDTETLNSLTNIKVPQKFAYIFKEKCWYFFENLRVEQVYVENYLASLLQYFVGSIKVLESLPNDFCKHIITQYFIEKPQKDYCLQHINYFVCLFLCLKSEQSDNFKFVFDILSLFKNRNNTRIVREFFINFHRIAVRNIKDNNKIDIDNNYHIELFKQHWHRLFTPIEMFDEHVLIDLLYLKSKSLCLVENYAKEVVIYLEELVSTYGPYIYTQFKDLLLSKDSLSNNEKYAFFYNILVFNHSALNCILVIDLIENHCSNDEFKGIRHSIIEILKTSNEPIVNIYFNKFLGDEM